MQLVMHTLDPLDWRHRCVAQPHTDFPDVAEQELEQLQRDAERGATLAAPRDAARHRRLAVARRQPERPHT
eukprot:6214458-Pleurochrysis_carterae.AAC.13